MANITANEFESLSDLIYHKTGIRFEPKKLYFVSKRIQKRMEALGTETASEYIRILRFADPVNHEFQRLTDLLTINETYFFRDFPQLQAFGEHCLLDYSEEKAARGDRSLRIWSAGCSTGEEPYTLGIIILEMLDHPSAWDINITAGDIDLGALKKAKKGVYDDRSLRDVPPSYLQRHFQKRQNGLYSISPKVRNMVRFEHINLSDKKEIRKKMGFDFIFCRNLLIYFDDISRKHLVDQFYVALKPGGYIFLGSSESVGRISTAFKIRRAGGYIVYYK
ncbi:CheR family methyltransferase [Desulfonema magnum]|uniref:protein-glutamate O-methyltransferase n=1 Tax=Desulfonema magnum TaxID=45655 RepID=A0A975GNR3_9BACT|nr:protein-glutamate O-methyltransferase CheR [Desulfonema magnum]QTA88049.1 Chemotaxis protein methyltransferase [Desulfonema magnum]